MGAFTVRVCLLAVSIALLPCRDAHATRKWWWSKVGRRHKWSFAVEGGLRYFTHYNQQAVISTPPGSMLGEFQANLWYKKTGGFYLLFSRSASSDASQLFGGGVKLPFLAFSSSSRSVVGGVTMMLIGDVVSCSFPAPTPPKIYPASTLAVRYGAGINWGLGASGAYLDTTMMMSSVNGNFFIAPLVGVGFQF